MIEDSQREGVLETLGSELALAEENNDEVVILGPGVIETVQAILNRMEP